MKILTNFNEENNYIVNISGKQIERRGYDFLTGARLEGVTNAETYEEFINEYIDIVTEKLKKIVKLDITTNLADSENNGLLSKEDYSLLKNLAEKVQKIETEAKNIKEFKSMYEFPNNGIKEILYLDKENNKIYRWDNENNDYYCVGSDYNNIEIINGGNA